MACDGCLDDLRDLILNCTDLTALRGYISEAMERLCAERCRGQLITLGLDPQADPEAATEEAFPELPTCECSLLILHDTNDVPYLSANNGLTWVRFPDMRHNITTSNPTVNDDSADGYSIGSRWINTATDTEFVCVDATLGAAVWVQTTNENQVMVEIASGKLGVAAATIDITGIPQTYHDLILVLRLRCTAANTGMTLRFNGDSGANYAYKEAEFSGTLSIIDAVNQTQGVYGRAMTASSATAGYFASLEIRIPDYYRDDITKIAQHINSYFPNATSTVYSTGNVGWENVTDGIDQITLTPSAGNFAIGSSWVLYGVGSPS